MLVIYLYFTGIVLFLFAFLWTSTHPSKKVRKNWINEDGDKLSELEGEAIVLTILLIIIWPFTIIIPILVKVIPKLIDLLQNLAVKIEQKREQGE